MYEISKIEEHEFFENRLNREYRYIWGDENNKKHDEIYELKIQGRIKIALISKYGIIPKIEELNGKLIIVLQNKLYAVECNSFKFEMVEVGLWIDEFVIYPNGILIISDCEIVFLNNKFEFMWKKDTDLISYYNIEDEVINCITDSGKITLSILDGTIVK